MKIIIVMVLGLMRGAVCASCSSAPVASGSACSAANNHPHNTPRVAPLPLKNGFSKDEFTAAIEGHVLTDCVIDAADKRLP